MNKLKILFITCLMFSILGYSQGRSAASVRQFNTMMNLGFLVKNPENKLRIDGTPYLFKNWDQKATIVTKGGETFKMKDVNFDGRRNKIVAQLPGDSLYTFNSFSIKRAVINGKIFENIIAADGGPIKVYEVIARSPKFTILKDHTIEISEGSSNPMRGTIYSRYITREDYFLYNGKTIEKFKLKKSKVLDLLVAKQEAIKTYVEEKDLNYKNEKDLNEIVNFYSDL